MIRLVIADDHAVVRMGLRFVLKINPDIEVVAEAADGDEAMKAVRESRKMRMMSGSIAKGTM